MRLRRLMQMNRSGDDLARPVPPREINRGRALWWQAAVLTLLVAVLYGKVAAALVLDWWKDPNFSHGFLVPPLSLFVVWLERKRLAALPVRPSWWGLLFVAGAMSILVVGILGAEFFLSRSSFVILLAGLVVYFLGWGYLRAALFPLGFLFVMIPIPVIIFNQVAFPLQFLASQMASALLKLIGVPVLREGNVIQLAVMPLEVAEACSGIRSLMSLIALALIYGYFLEPRTSRRTLLAAAAVPIAVVANSLRVLGTGLMVQWWDPEKALGFFHIFSGWIIFVVSMGMLFAVHAAMRLVDRWRGVRKT